MYDKAGRFKNIKTNTPPNVGPSTYIIPDEIIGFKEQRKAAFLSSSPLKTALSINAICQPSPADYFPHYRKNRILGGTSLRNKSKRFKKYKGVCLNTPSPVTYNIYKTYERKQGVGKLYVCQPPRWRKTTPTIPEKGLLYYDFKSDGTVEKVIEQIGNTWPSPTYYNVPQGEICFNTKKYKGISWSRMKDIRFKNQIDYIPGPADYDLLQKCTPQYKLDQEKYCMRLKSVSKQEERYLDKVMNMAKREDLPGPGAYNIINPKFSKNEVSTFARAKKDDFNKLLTNPGPASYNYSCSSILKPFKYTSYKNSPFMVDCLRFPTTDKFTPGPSEYDPYKGLFYENQKKFNPMITKNIPFSTTSSRKLDSINPNKDSSPSPASYNLQKKPIRQTKVYNLFGSRAPRFLEKSSHMTQPNCASYSVEKSFNAIKNPTSHLKSKTAIFMTTISDSKELKRRTSLPGPATYELPSSTLNTRSCFFTKPEKGLIQITPGPCDYHVNPNVCKPNIFTTHNVTIKPDQRIPPLNWYKKLSLPRKLGCFV